MKKTPIIFITAVLMMLATGLMVSAQSAPLPAPGLDVVGRGYNVFGKYAEMESIMPYQLFEFSNTTVIPSGVERYRVPELVSLKNISKHNITKVEGSSLKSYANSLSVRAGLGVDSMFFKASVESSFESSENRSTSSYFYTYSDAITKWQVTLQTRSLDDLREDLEPRAKEDLDGGMDARTFLETYGAYYISDAYLGGRADLNVKVDTSSIDSSFNIGVHVEASYKVVSGSADTQQSSKKSALDKVSKTELTVVGGHSEYASDITNYDQYSKWVSGIKDFPVLCDFEEGGLRPIWELAGSEARRTELKSAFEEMKKEFQLPPEMLNIMAVKNDFFMVEAPGSGLYWDFQGYNYKAAANEGDAVSLYATDTQSYDKEGMDRFIRVNPVPEKDSYWVYLQPQHTARYSLIADKNNKTLILGEGGRNRESHFEMRPVSGTRNQYYLITRENDLAVTRNGRKITLTPFWSGNADQMWEFDAAAPGDAAAPTGGIEYSIRSAAIDDLSWDISGTYPFLRDTAVQLWTGSPDAADRRILLIGGDNDSNRCMVPMSHAENDGKYYGLFGASSDNTVSLQKSNTRSAQQQWEFRYAGAASTYYIISKKDGRAMTAVEKGQAVKLERFNANNKKQKWVLTKERNISPSELLHSGRFQINTVSGGFLLETKGYLPDNDKNGSDIIVWTGHNEKDGIVRFIPQLNGSFLIEFQTGSGRVLDRSSSDGLKNGAHIQLWEPNGKESQQWRPQRVDGENFVIIQRINGKELYLDVVGGENVEKGSEVQLYRKTGDRDQLWTLYPLDGPFPGELF